jgi:hypothetical protein
VPESDLSWTSSTWSRHLDALPAKFTPRRPAPTPAEPQFPSTVPGQRGPSEAATASPVRPAPAAPVVPVVPAAPTPPAPPRPAGLRALIRRIFGR